jgi:hypothetical protein
MLQVFATLASLWLVVRGAGWALNAPKRALDSINNLVDARADATYKKAALLLSQAQVQLADAPENAEKQKLNFKLQRAYELALDRNPGTFEMMQQIFQSVQQGWGPLCPNCGQKYGERRLYCQHCRFHRTPIQVGDRIMW